MSGPVKAPERILKRLDWTVLRRLDGVLQGNYRSLFRGTGMDLAEIREYQPHDDVRHIDWNVTARQGSPYVRRYNEDREVTVWFLLDMSPSMDFASGHLSKRALLIDVLALLGRIFSRQGNRVGAIIYTAGIDHIIQPGTGSRHLLSIIDRLTRHPAPEAAPATDLSALFIGALSVLKRRNVVFVVSDFVSEGDWKKPLALLSRRHETTAVRLIDPLETELPDIGLVTLQDAETGEQLLVDTQDAGFRERYARLCEERDNELINDLIHSGADVLELATDDDLFASLLKFIQMRTGRSSPRTQGVSSAIMEPAT